MGIEYNAIESITARAEFLEQYFGMANTDLYLCPECGSVVADKEVHTDFHEKLLAMARQGMRNALG